MSVLARVALVFRIVVDEGRLVLPPRVRFQSCLDFDDGRMETRERLVLILQADDVLLAGLENARLAGRVAITGRTECFVVRLHSHYDFGIGAFQLHDLLLILEVDLFNAFLHASYFL